jgi:CHAD domain-containing protein
VSLRLPSKLPPGAGLRAVLLSLAGRAKRDVERVAAGPEERIHGLRTGMKKYRSVLRLAHDGVKPRLREALRERVRILKDGMAGSRDDVVILKTVRRVLGSAAARRLKLKSPHRAGKVEAPEALLLAADELVVLTETLELDDLDAGDLNGRLRRSLRRAQKAMKTALRSSEAHAFHLWRKHVKNVWYQSAVLGGLGKKIAALRKPAEKLSDVLGSEHDLTIVLTTVKDLTPVDREVLEDARQHLRSDALALAAKLRG